MQRYLLLSVFAVCTVYVSQAQTPTATQILENMKKQFDPVNDYTATVQVSVDMERFQAPEMPATIYFKKPDKVHVDSKNFAMVPRQAVPVNPVQLLAKFNASLLGTEKRGDSTFYKLRLVSKPEKGKPVTEWTVWVEGAHWVATHFETSPWELRKISADFEYRPVGGVLMPSKISLMMESQQQSDSTAERTYNPQRAPRKGSVTIHYLDYKINTNLPDEIFEKKRETSP